MEELLDEMRVLFDGLTPKVPPVAAENLLDISGEIPSLTRWGHKIALMETPTKPDQRGPSELTKEEEAPTQPDFESPPRRRIAEPVVAHKEVPVNTIVEEVVRELAEEQSHTHRVETPQRPARIDVVQTGPEEVPADRMRELPMPPTGSTPEPITFFMPRLQLHPSFISELERITRSPFKTPGTISSGRLPVLILTPESTGPDTRDELEPSGSGRTSREGVEAIEASSRAARVTRSIAKQMPGGSTPTLSKRAILSSAKGSSSKMPKK